VIGGGRFIVLEGGEASGKSTQVPLLAGRLRAAGRQVVETLEPGATELGARVRRLLLDGLDGLNGLDGPDGISATAEALLLAADRAQHVAQVVRPALARGADVVSDRYTPSTLAYQGAGRGLGSRPIEALNELATGGLEPDLVVVLDVSEETAAARRRGPPDRLERAGVGFHAAVRQAYRDLAAEHGWEVVDGDVEVGDVAERVWTVVAERLGIEP
jgi:dTMP kinase